MESPSNSIQALPAGDQAVLLDIQKESRPTPEEGEGGSFGADPAYVGCVGSVVGIFPLVVVVLVISRGIRRTRPRWRIAGRVSSRRIVLVLDIKASHGTVG